MAWSQRQLTIAVGLLSLVTLVSAAVETNDPRPADPFADPRHDPFNPLKYIASNVLTAIAFTLVMIVALTQSLWIKVWGAKWMLSMVIGCYTFAAGLAMRFGLHSSPESKGLYIAEYTLVVLSPCAFIAADYVLLGRLARYLKADKFLLVSPRRITITFVTSDIVTFLIQATGGSLSASANRPQQALNGSHIFLGGLAAQLVSFFVFTIIYLTFLYRVRKYSPDIWNMDHDKPWHQSWRTLATVLIVSCIGILIRSLYRVIELSEGFQGRLASSETFFYCLDTLPLFIAIAVYIPFWPGRFIENKAASSISGSDIEKETGST